MPYNYSNYQPQFSIGAAQQPTWTSSPYGQSQMGGQSNPYAGFLGSGFGGGQPYMSPYGQRPQNSGGVSLNQFEPGQPTYGGQQGSYPPQNAPGQPIPPSQPGTDNNTNTNDPGRHGGGANTGSTTTNSGPYPGGVDTIGGRRQSYPGFPQMHPTNGGLPVIRQGGMPGGQGGTSSGNGGGIVGSGYDFHITGQARDRGQPRRGTGPVEGDPSTFESTADYNDRWRKRWIDNGLPKRTEADRQARPG